MKTTTIIINYNQYQTIQAMRYACSKNTNSSTLQHINYNAEKKRLEACDGHILRLEYMDLGSDDFLITEAFICDTKKQIAVKYGKQFLTGETVQQFQITFDDTEQYPEIEKIIPPVENYNIDKPNFLYGISAKYLVKIQKSFINESDMLIFVPTRSNISPIMIYATNSGGKYLAGLIMPLRIIDDITITYRNKIKDIQEAKQTIAA